MVVDVVSRNVMKSSSAALPLSAVVSTPVPRLRFVTGGVDSDEHVVANALQAGDQEIEPINDVAGHGSGFSPSPLLLLALSS